ncbi:hypothetical protein BT69DRAFT_1283839 [Atractiella rhizophila]|nr:hypothetical protein BT69DRAFT_1283839 [Atractiella rhizophila]
MPRIPPLLPRLLFLSLLLLLPTLYYLKSQIPSSPDPEIVYDVPEGKGRVGVVGIGGSGSVLKDEEDGKGKVELLDLDHEEVGSGGGGGGKHDHGGDGGEKDLQGMVGGVGSGLWEGGVIMDKMANETVRAELGRATWKLLHTMAQRFPKTPTASERQTFVDFFHLLGRLYPCGECAEHFQSLLSQYPPQTSSRDKAGLWLCFLHNQVNLSLKKDEFDCNELEGKYDCGCGEEPSSSSTTAQETSTTAEESAEETSNKMVVLAKPGIQVAKSEPEEEEDDDDEKGEEKGDLWGDEAQEG